MEKFVIVGGGAAGASCAARLRRLNEDAEITIVEKTNEVSIANCGLPYYVSGVINEREKILVSTPEKFKDWFRIRVKLNTEVKKIDRAKKTINLSDEETLPYDKLVLAQGANPIVPDFPGMSQENVFSLRNLNDADKIKKYIQQTNAKKAVVVGAGFIGLEIAENLIELGLDTTIVELADQVLTTVDKEIAKFAENEIKEHGINLILSDGVKEFNGKQLILTSSETVDFDFVVMAIGVKPELTLAKECGLETNKGIIVNECMQTSDEHIYAAGDMAEVKDLVFGQNTMYPLAGPANKQGRIIADNIGGLKSIYNGSLGASVVKIFGLTISSVGHNEKQLIKNEIPYLKTFAFSRSHAGYYPDSSLILLKLIFSDTGKIYGAQAVGYAGVEKRMDIISTIMRKSGTVQDLEENETCYAPPYSSAKDPVNILGMNADNILKGLLKPAYMEDLDDAFLIDVRPEISYKTSTIPGAANISITAIRSRINEVPKDKKVILFCSTGYTSYCASRILIQKGFDNVYSLCGGIELYKELKKKINVVKQIPSPIENSAIETTTIDASGLQCPGPILKVSNALERAENGKVFQVISTDRGFKPDIEAWCETTGNTLLDIKTQDKKIIATIQKGRSNMPIDNVHQIANSPNGQTIVVFSNDLDRVFASFVIANGAKASGKNVTMFFTFWGLNILRKPNVKTKKCFTDKMFSMMMPGGINKLSLSKMNIGGIGSYMMKSVMKNKKISSLPELIEQAQTSGIKFIACSMSMDVMGIKPEELIDGVEIGGVAKYIATTNNANANLFI